MIEKLKNSELKVHFAKEMSGLLSNPFIMEPVLKAERPDLVRDKEIEWFRKIAASGKNLVEALINEDADLGRDLMKTAVSVLNQVSTIEKTFPASGIGAVR